MNYNDDISKLNIGENSSDRQHLYYNVRIDNPIDDLDNSPSENCVYNKQTGVILKQQSDYELAIQSWSIRANLPIFIATIEQGGNLNRNLMPFSTCFTYTIGGITYNYPTPLIWVPSPGSISEYPLPRAPGNNNGLQDLTTSPTYYNNNSYLNFINIINTSLASGFADFQAEHP